VLGPSSFASHSASASALKCSCVAKTRSKMRLRWLVSFSPRVFRKASKARMIDSRFTGAGA
jgi:hypothetical protein